MSHEIRTPLSTILGALEVLGESPLAGEQFEMFELLERAGDHLRSLIDGILDLSKIEAGGIVLEKSAFSVAALIREVAQMLRGRAEAKGLTFSCGTPSEGAVLGDVVRLRQVLVNLVANAIKFTERGSVTLCAETAGPRAVRFSVADTGIGIALEKQGAVFDAFEQADPSTTRLHGGTGLGLTIARKLAEMMGGSLVLKSSVGVGTEFSFTLELPPAPAQAFEQDVHANGGWELLRITDRSPRPTILVADDLAENRMLLKAFLRGGPFELTFAEHGAEAVEVYQRVRPALVLLDLHMPKVDGFTAATRIRELERDHRLPPVTLVAFTADAFEETRRRCTAAGFSGHLVKPVTRASLRDIVVRALRSHEPPEALVSESPGEFGPFDDELRVLLPEYIERRSGDVRSMRAALQRGDYSLVARLAHQIKGTGASYGFAPLTDLGTRLEAAALRESSEAVIADIDAMERYLGEALAHIDR